MCGDGRDAVWGGRGAVPLGPPCQGGCLWLCHRLGGSRINTTPPPRIRSAPPLTRGGKTRLARNLLLFLSLKQMLRHGVVAAVTEGVATKHPPNSQPQTHDGAVTLQRLHRIGGAGGHKAAVAPMVAGHALLIQPHQADEPGAGQQPTPLHSAITPNCLRCRSMTGVSWVLFISGVRVRATNTMS